MQKNGRKIILRPVGRGKMLQCLLGKEMMPLHYTWRRNDVSASEWVITVFKREGGRREDTGILSQKIDVLRRFADST